MDRNEVLAFRESGKIEDFMDAMVAQGRMTDFERGIVDQEINEVYRHAGYLDRNNRCISTGGDERAAVERQSNYVMRRKIVEFHPELETELDQFIARRRYHPLPPVPSHLAKPGAALGQYQALIGFIEEKRKQGVIRHGEAHEMYAPAIEVFEDSGIDHGEVSVRTDRAVLAQAHHLMKQRLIELHPELAPELRRYGRGRGR